MKRKFSLFRKGKASFESYLVFSIAFFLIVLLLILFLTNRFLHAPKILLLCVIILVAVFLGKLKILIKDWFVFLAFVYLADSLRGFIYFLICKFNFPVYILYAIKMENFLFGGIPSNFLQNALLGKEGPADFTWLEKSLTVIHGTHFIAFLFIGLVIWIHKSDYFRDFKISFYLLISMGIAVYFVIPTAPPWLPANLFKIICTRLLDSMETLSLESLSFLSLHPINISHNNLFWRSLYRRHYCRSYAGNYLLLYFHQGKKSPLKIKLKNN